MMMPSSNNFKAVRECVCVCFSHSQNDKFIGIDMLRYCRHVFIASIRNIEKCLIRFDLWNDYIMTITKDMFEIPTKKRRKRNGEAKDATIMTMSLEMSTIRN